MDKGWTRTKFVRIALPKIPQIPRSLFGRSSQIGQKIWDMIEKTLIGRPYSMFKLNKAPFSAPLKISFKPC